MNSVVVWKIKATFDLLQTSPKSVKKYHAHLCNFSSNCRHNTRTSKTKLYQYDTSLLHNFLILKFSVTGWTWQMNYAIEYLNCKFAKVKNKRIREIWQMDNIRAYKASKYIWSKNLNMWESCERKVSKRLN